MEQRHPGSLSDLRRVAADAGCEDLLSHFPDTYLLRVLDHYSPTDALSRLRRAETTLTRLKQWEQEVDMEAMRRLIAAGLIMTRGRTNDGLGIVWAATFRTPYTRTYHREYVLLLIWVVQWARRNRLHEDDGIAIVVDDTGRAMLDFSTSQILDIGRAAAGLAPVSRQNEKWVFFFNGEASQTVASILFKYAPRFRRQSTFPASRAEVVQCVADPADAAPAFQPYAGVPYEVSVETVGLYEDLLARRGFADLELRDLYRLSKRRVDGMLRSYYARYPAAGGVSDVNPASEESHESRPSWISQIDAERRFVPTLSDIVEESAFGDREDEESLSFEDSPEPDSS